MGLLRPLKNEQAYFKAAFYGFAGSGKTFPSALTAIGLAKFIGVKTVAMFETETGADYVQPGLYEPAGIELVGIKSRAFSDCMAVIDEAEKKGIKILVIDSVSHMWKELITAYKTKNRKTQLFLREWGDIKEDWTKFSNKFLVSNLHIIICGRAGYEWDYEQIEQGDEGQPRGEKKLIKTGIKMRAEGEFGYEPSLVVRMEREKVYDAKQMTQSWVRRACVEKDRFDVIDGKDFDNPTFESFWPHIERLNLGGEHIGFDASRTSEAMLADPDYSAADRRRRRLVALEEIQATIVKYLPGQAAKDKTAKINILENLFRVRSWTSVEEKAQLHVLEEALKSGRLEELCANAAGVEVSPFLYRAGAPAEGDGPAPEAPTSEDQAGDAVRREGSGHPVPAAASTETPLRDAPSDDVPMEFPSRPDLPERIAIMERRWRNVEGDGKTPKARLKFRQEILAALGRLYWQEVKEDPEIDLLEPREAVLQEKFKALVTRLKFEAQEPPTEQPKQPADGKLF